MGESTFLCNALTDEHDLSSFDCGAADHDRWLTAVARTAVRSGTAAVYVLTDPRSPSVLGYYAIAPTAVARVTVPRTAAGNGPDLVPGYLLARLALDRSVQGDPGRKWGTQLVVDALRRIVAAAAVGGGRVVVVDADNQGLVPFYEAHSFLPTRHDPLRLYMKVATARRLLAMPEPS